jgi:YHYH protein
MRRSRRSIAVVAAGALIAGCGSAAVAATHDASTRYASTPTSPGPVNPNAIPLGDGYVSTTPRVGYVDSCVTNFGGIGGARTDGPWINTKTKTWSEKTKIHVSGMVNWPDAAYSVTVKGSKRIIAFDDLPIDHTSGTFPIQSTDPAYEYDQNGNHIAEQSFHWSVPLNPRAARTPGCTPGGEIGVLSDGVALFNALDGEGRDAGAHEVLDACGGHPDPADVYHHHDVPPCILSRVRNGTTKLVGYALDGYGIYVVKSARGTLPTNTDLDRCHGTTSVVVWNGKPTRIYHYVATLEYPYTVGCFHGTPSSAGGPTGAPGSGPTGPPAPPPT